MLIDSHCHLDRIDLLPFGNDFSTCMKEISKADIHHMLCVSINLEKYPLMKAMVDSYEQISVSVGVHPTETGGKEPTVEDLVALGQDPKVVAIGETGLDYFRQDCDVALQQQRFRTHIRAAIELQKPLIIHTREARDDTLNILREEGAGSVGGVLHCFTEDWDTASQALDLNFYISLSGILTFKNAQQIQEVARKLPQDRMLIETDSPYLAPIPKRGKTNYPFYIKYVAEYLAEIRGESTENIALTTSRNFYRLFASAAGQDALTL